MEQDLGFLRGRGRGEARDWTLRTWNIQGSVDSHPMHDLGPPAHPLNLLFVHLQTEDDEFSISAHAEPVSQRPRKSCVNFNDEIQHCVAERRAAGRDLMANVHLPSGFSASP